MSDITTNALAFERTQAHTQEVTATRTNCCRSYSRAKLPTSYFFAFQARKTKPATAAANDIAPVSNMKVVR